MPLALNPHATLSIHLDIDAGLAPDIRPEFIVRFPSKLRVAKHHELWAKQRDASRKYLAAHDEHDKADDARKAELAKAMQAALAESDAALRETLALHVVGWRNLRDGGEDLPFSLDTLCGILTYAEQVELADKCLEETLPKEGDLKNSVSPLASSAAKSAKPAAAESVNQNGQTSA